MGNNCNCKCNCGCNKKEKEEELSNSNINNSLNDIKKKIVEVGFTPNKAKVYKINKKIIVDTFLHNELDSLYNENEDSQDEMKINISTEKDGIVIDSLNIESNFSNIAINDGNINTGSTINNIKNNQFRLSNNQRKNKHDELIKEIENIKIDLSLNSINYNNEDDNNESMTTVKHCSFLTPPKYHSDKKLLLSIETSPFNKTNSPTNKKPKTSRKKKPNNVQTNIHTQKKLITNNKKLKIAKLNIPFRQHSCGRKCNGQCHLFYSSTGTGASLEKRVNGQITLTTSSERNDI